MPYSRPTRDGVRSLICPRRLLGRSRYRQEQPRTAGAIAVDRAARLCSRHAVGAIPSAMATSAIPITTAAVSILKLGWITPRSAIKEGIAKCFGAQAAATRAPIGVPAPAVAVQQQLPLSWFASWRSQPRAASRTGAVCRHRGHAGDWQRTMPPALLWLRY